MITVTNLCFSYGPLEVLKSLDFTLPKGSVTALVGANGAGKTTLLRSLAALQVPQSGTLLIDGFDTQKEPRKCHHIVGYLSDFFGLYDDLTVRQSLLHRCLLYSIDDPQTRIKETAAQVDLSHKLDALAGTLSRGQRQRLGIAQAIIHKPKLLLLDEPASGLDPGARYELSLLLKSLQAEGITIVVSSHIISELEEYCDHVLMLKEGLIAEQQSLHILHSSPIKHTPGNIQVQLRYTMRVVESSSHDPFQDHQEPEPTEHKQTGHTKAQQLHEVLASIPEIMDVQITNSEISFDLISPTGEEQLTAHKVLKILLERNIAVYTFTPETKRLQHLFTKTTTSSEGRA